MKPATNLRRDMIREGDRRLIQLGLFLSLLFFFYLITAPIFV